MRGKKEKNRRRIFYILNSFCRTATRFVDLHFNYYNFKNEVRFAYEKINQNYDVIIYITIIFSI